MMTFLVICAYLIGSIPSGYLLIKYKYGEDIRASGSGNIGATNVSRCYGKKMGNLTQACDMAKAFIPVVVSDLLLKNSIIIADRSLLLTLVALATILGHNYSIFLKFKGGKGVATTAGAFSYILLIPMLIAGAFFIGLRFITKIVSIRSIVLGLVLFLSTLILGYNITYVYGTLTAFILIIIRHRDNIKRLIKGEEK